MEPKDIAYAVGIFLTFAIGVWNLVQNYRNTRRTNFINTVTSQRVKWIEQLRQDISTFSGLTYTWSASNMEGKPQEPEMVREIDRLRHVIRLRLNPRGKHDSRIETLLEEIPKYTDPGQSAKLAAALTDLTTTTQLLLTEEWEKVKKESEYGNLQSGNG
ncbi:hypothetical protein [Halomonas sp. LBP4]|uniref:hypothetical protein n=1 Tax=Halomonas sp. LBP4 TaxID=2044917 RepID=UPI000D762F17|nr:hypothetical protein [Halomonas sp. LBP4]PXX95910.1 hypothetical protein CR157_17075 [Halomonas sp. LBP4]